MKTGVDQSMRMIGVAFTPLWATIANRREQFLVYKKQDLTLDSFPGQLPQ